MADESTKTYGFSDIFFIHQLYDNIICKNRVKYHFLIYVIHGEMVLVENGKEIIISAGECVFIRRDHRLSVIKRPKDGKLYKGISMVFKRDFLRQYIKKIDPKYIPIDAKPLDNSVIKLPNEPSIKSIFISMVPYFDEDVNPIEESMDFKVQEGVLALLNINKNFYPTLFDFSNPWKIDIIEFLNDNYMYELTMEEIASFTGRSLSTFKRDFKNISDLSPQKWIIQKRLEKAYDLFIQGNKSVSNVFMDVGFKNRSHFTIAFKKHFGFSPKSLAVND